MYSFQAETLFLARIVCNAFMYLGSETITLSKFVKPIPSKYFFQLIAGVIFCNSAMVIGLYCSRPSLRSTLSRRGLDNSFSNAKILAAFTLASAADSPANCNILAICNSYFSLFSFVSFSSDV